MAMILTVALSAAFLSGQAARPLDDRELFVRPQTSNQILPNVMLMADNSGSMNTAIYHPAYNPTINYVTSGYTLNGLNRGDDPMTWFDSYSGYYRLGTTINFRICRGAVQSIQRTAYGRFISRSGSGPTYYWTIQQVNGAYPYIAGETIEYNTSNTCASNRWYSTTIQSVTYNGTLATITVTTNRTPSASCTNSRNMRSRYYEAVPVENTASFNTTSENCDTGAETHQVSLFGTTNGASGNPYTRYDTNYIWWLAFYATPQQLVEVRNWATTHQFPVNGVLRDVGWYRMEVLRRVLIDVASEVYKTVNMGLFKFRPNADGGELVENMANHHTGGTLNAFINKIEDLYASTNTPLAETLADIWTYFKGGANGLYNYVPLDWLAGSTQCGHGTGGGFPTACPIQYWCQRNYVIMMTDGTSVDDDFRETKFGSSSTNIFKTNINNWGDLDSNDPRSTSPTYCPLETCYQGDEGTDYLDDVAYYLRMNDMFPDDKYGGDMQGTQNIITYTIGFTINNDLLAETARNGDGQFYVATDYLSLKNALTNAIFDILIREFAFASFTAPKRATSSVSEGYSYVGYFKPSLNEAIWDGFLQNYKLSERWCCDVNNNQQIDDGECDTLWETEAECEAASGNKGKQCLSSLEFGTIPEWKAEKVIETLPTPRKIYTHYGNNNTFNLNDPARLSTVKLLWGLTEDLPATNIINKIYEKKLADIFHSDITFVGSPPLGKTFLINYNPPECNKADLINDTDCYTNFFNANTNRSKVIFVGTNDGVMHQFDALTGQERWGFIPDEALPKLKQIVLDSKYTFTVDGHSLAEDIYYRSGSGNGWKTTLTFGMRDGGNAFYSLDVTNTNQGQPLILWKFKNSEYSGRSWGKPQTGKIRYQVGTDILDYWVTILPGGMAFNNEDPNVTHGKAVFVVNASNGELIWMIGFNNTTGANDNSSPEIDVTTENPSSGNPGIKHLTRMADFNFPIPSALTAIDKNNDGYVDTIYYGNVAGHLFKTDITNPDPRLWKSYELYKTNLSTNLYDRTITSITGTELTLNTSGLELVNHVIIGLNSKAMALVTNAYGSQNRTITIQKMSEGADFLTEPIAVRAYDPIFMAPAITYDKCFNMWVCFGTGDRVRARSNPTSGGFFAIKDGTTASGGPAQQKTLLTKANLADLTAYWASTTDEAELAPTPIDMNLNWGFFFVYPDNANHEKLFDPDPIILPDQYGAPNIYFNTYQPPENASGSGSDPCKVEAGKMMIYDICIDICGNGRVFGSSEVGRIAGGGMFSGTEYIIYEGNGAVGSIPPLKGIIKNDLRKIGGVVFFKEKKR